MNDEARAELDRILAIEPAALTESEQAFLSARRDYLTEDQRVTFGLTEESSAGADSTSAEEAEAPRARRGRRIVEEV
jgi:hypothetical protein